MTAGSAVTTYAYLTSNGLSTDPFGAVTTSTYNGSRVLVSTDYPIGSRLTFVYDAIGVQSAVVDPLGITTMSYAGANLLSSKTDKMGRTALYCSDSNVRLTTVTVLYIYNSDTGDTTLDVYAIVDPMGNRTSYTYNVDGTVSAIQDARGLVTSLGRKLTLKDLDNNVRTYSYDTVGQLSTMKAPNGKLTTYQYDAAGRETTVVYGERRITMTTTYDATGNALVTMG
jgi:YD repeat-containing protein